MTNCFTKIRNWFARSMFVVIDGRGNSLTLSSKLYKHMDVASHSSRKVFVFAVDNTFGFCFQDNDKGLEGAAVCELAINERFNSIGFDLVNPTAAQILYKFNLPADGAYKFSVRPCTTGDLHYYKILFPAKTDKND